MCQCLALPRQMQQALPRLTHATAKFGPSGTAMAMKLVGLTRRLTVLLNLEPKP